MPEILNEEFAAAEEVRAFAATRTSDPGFIFTNVPPTSAISVSDVSCIEGSGSIRTTWNVFENTAPAGTPTAVLMLKTCPEKDATPPTAIVEGDTVTTVAARSGRVLPVEGDGEGIVVRSSVVPTHTGLAPQESVAGLFVVHDPFPPTQVYGGFEAAIPQAVGQVGGVQMPPGVTTQLVPFHVLPTAHIVINFHGPQSLLEFGSLTESFRFQSILTFAQRLIT